LLRAYDLLALDAGASNYADFFMTLSLLLGPLEDETKDGPPTARIAYYVTQAGLRKNVPVYVVFYEGIRTAVAVRPSCNKFKLATCCLLSCKSCPWGRIDAKAVNKITRVDAESDALLV